ncbi:MAG: hypothetical protein LBL34_04430 [Clostridiales bacterium]|nr:hypothetical protein [Clostridiales bacterium]
MKTYGLFPILLISCILNFCQPGYFKARSSAEISPSPGPWQIWQETSWERTSAENGINIREIINEYVSSANSDVTDMKYSVIYCNLSREDLAYNNDILLMITAEHQWGNRMLLYAFVCEDGRYGGQYKKVFGEQHNYIRYQTIDVNGDYRQELLIHTDDSGNMHTLMPIKALMYDDENKAMTVIFDEILAAYAYLPRKTIGDDNYYTISFDNDYSFIPSANKGFDIEFTSEIFERENEILQRGQTRFTFNGKKYVPVGEYYDYKAIAQKIYDEKQ